MDGDKMVEGQIREMGLKVKGLEETLDFLDTALLLIDHNHCIQWMNKRAIEWFGPLEVGKRRVCYRTLEYSEGFCSICPTGVAIDRGTPVRYELPIYYKGRQRLLEITGLPVFDREGSISMVMEVIIDVTERMVEKKRTDELMAQIEKMAAIGQLAAGVAHELNTPLATISVISEELRAIMGSKSLCEGLTRENIQEYLWDMDCEIKRCQRIIKDLLSFSKKGVFQLKETDINEVVTKTVDFILKGNIDCKGRVSIELDKGLPVIETDPLRFQQTLFNCLKNALEAVSDLKDGKVRVSTFTDSQWLKVVIEDNGPGIPPHHLKRVFEPFFTTKQPGKGTGLGLSVSYGIMKELNGDIVIESTEGKGTIATLLLPIRYENETLSRR